MEDFTPDPTRTDVQPPRELMEQHAVRKMHRVATVRQQQGVSLRTASRHTGLTQAALRDQEDETVDLRVSDLMRWQKVLDVPLADLLVDTNGPLSRPVSERAQMLRLMKTAAAILEQAESKAVSRMARTLVDQLIALMPELAEVGPWHSVGQRRSADEVGRTAERPVSDQFLTRSQ